MKSKIPNRCLKIQRRFRAYKRKYRSVPEIKLSGHWCRENVPLLPIAKEIIERYKDHPYCRANDVLLPINSNQKFNSYLKEIAEICGIVKNLTAHTARHS